jgi:hypothetical protein
MIVDKIRLEETADHCLLTARVIHEDGPGGKNDLWFRFPSALRPLLTTSADPFLVALLMPAMVLEKRLLIEGEVCPRLLENSIQVQDIITCWLRNSRRVPIESGRRASVSLQPAGGTGVFFSAGVDSFHTLLKNLDAITHLLLMERFDYKMINSDAVNRDTRKQVARVATSFGKKLLVLQSNARLLYLPAVSWSDYHGAVLASMGLALGNCFQRILIPATYTYTQLHPWGSHPLLDPLWSTRQTRIVHDGAEASRSQKVMDWICRSDLALQNLRVCFEPGDDYNCGHCEKCIRTMVPIYVAGKLGASPVFPSEFPVTAIERHIFKNLGQYQYAEENIALLAMKAEPTPLDFQIKQALENAILRSRAHVARQEVSLVQQEARLARRKAKMDRRERRRKVLQSGSLLEKLRLFAGRGSSSSGQI